MDFSNFVGKKVILDGQEGTVVRKDTSKGNNGRTYIIKFVQHREGIDVNDYDFYDEGKDAVRIVSKNKSSVLIMQSTNQHSVKYYYKKNETRENRKNQLNVFPYKSRRSYWPVPSKDDRIYHSTAMGNMINIIKRNGLLSRWQLLQMGLIFQDTAHPGIIHWRKKLGIENMIPFHFKSKTPYEYAVFTNNSDGKKHNTISPEDMVVIAIGKHKYDYCSHVFTAHPLSNNAQRFYANNEVLQNLHFWNVLDEYKGRSPKGYGDDINKKKQICMAEYDVGLSYIPLNDILEIYVQTKEKADILLEHDKAGILKGKIIIGDKRYLI